MLIIIWLCGCPSSLGEEAETGEGCWEVRQHPATSHLSCHLCYAFSGIQRAATGRQSWTIATEPHKLPPFLLSLHLHTMCIYERISVLASPHFWHSSKSYKSSKEVELKNWDAERVKILGSQCLQLQLLQMNLHSTWLSIYSLCYIVPFLQWDFFLCKS